MSNFIHLHVHSQYSLLDGKSTVAELVDTARADGQRGMALTDHGNMFGIKEFVNYVKKINSGLPDEEKFKPILGCEMYVARERLSDRGDKTDRGYHLIVLAKNQKGYHNLVRLVSKAWTDGFYMHPRTDRTELAAHSEGLIICSACLGGELPRMIEAGDEKGAEERAAWYKSVFGDDYYIELQRHKTLKENADTSTYEKQVVANEALIRIAKKLDIKLVATNDVHFAKESDAEAHDRLICMNTGKKFNEPRMHYTKQEWLKSSAEMSDIFSDIPEALATPSEILDKIEVYSIDHARPSRFRRISARRKAIGRNSRSRIYSMSSPAMKMAMWCSPKRRRKRRWIALEGMTVSTELSWKPTIWQSLPTTARKRGMATRFLTM